MPPILARLFQLRNFYSHKDSVDNMIRKGKDIEKNGLAQAIWHPSAARSSFMETKR
jgi:formyltetrahydrofolate hydrolase